MSIASEITRLQGAKASLKSSINAKNDNEHQITTETLEDYADFVDTISGGGKPEQTKSAIPSTSSQIITPDTGYTLSSVSISAMPSGVLSTPTVNSSTGLVTASIETSGYLASGTSKTLQLTTQGAQTITPTTSNQTITNGKYLTGTQTIAGDANLVAGNIKKNTTIFGVTGTYEGSGSATLVTKSITENGIYNASSDNADGYSQVTVNVSGGAIVEPEEKDVNFYDYDGTRVYSYTKTEYLALTEPPSLPTHTGLTGVNWNYFSFERSQQVVERDGFLDAGALYKTTDKATKIFVNLSNEFKTPYVYVGIPKNVGCYFDWGDGTTQTIYPSSNSTWINPSHTYSTGGKYTISILPMRDNYITLKCSGSANTFNDSQNTGALIWGGASSDSQQTNMIYANSVEEIWLGEKVLFDTTGRSFSGYTNLKAITGFTNINSDFLYIHDYLFFNCRSLKAIFFPKTFSLIKNYVFKNCVSLERCIFCSSRWASSSGDTSNYVFENCYSLKKQNLNFNNSLESYNTKITLGLTSYMFKHCYSINYIYLPPVSAIGSDTFSDDYKHVKVFDFTSNTEIPTLNGTNAFSSGTNDYEIWVPSSLYSSWIAAANWSNISSHIVAK